MSADKMGPNRRTLFATTCAARVNNDHHFRFGDSQICLRNDENKNNKNNTTNTATRKEVPPLPCVNVMNVRDGNEMLLEGGHLGPGRFRLRLIPGFNRCQLESARPGLAVPRLLQYLGSEAASLASGDLH